MANLLMATIPSTRLFGLKRWLWRVCGVEVGNGVHVNLGARIFGTGDVAIDAETWVGIGCTFIVPLGASICIGARCDIAPDVLFECGSHNIGGVQRRAGEGYAADISIGSGTWIGARAIVLGGSQVGPGSIVAAGAVVLPGVYPENVLLAGVPARVAKSLLPEAKSTVLK